jgi:hypothetical protein
MQRAPRGHSKTTARITTLRNMLELAVIWAHRATARAKRGQHDDARSALAGLDALLLETALLQHVIVPRPRARPLPMR